MRAAPATMGGMPRSSKRASERQSATSSRSPCTTWTAIAVWPSLKVVNSWARAAGMVELRGITFSTSPPIVSRPSESGITSRSSQSSPAARFPASALAWVAAPRATTCSGSRFTSGSRWKNDATARCRCGIRVAPPTSTTPSTCVAARPASRSALRVGTSVFWMREAVISSNSRRSRRRCSCCPQVKVTLASADCAPDRRSFTSRAAARRRRVSRPEASASPCALRQCLAIAWSKSSPPRAESPLVERTSKTPRVSLRMERSKVPPPRSNIAKVPSAALSRP